LLVGRRVDEDKKSMLSFVIFSLIPGICEFKTFSHFVRTFFETSVVHETTKQPWHEDKPHIKAKAITNDYL
jgi:hypothetical protein